MLCLGFHLSEVRSSVKKKEFPQFTSMCAELISEEFSPSLGIIAQKEILLLSVLNNCLNLG